MCGLNPRDHGLAGHYRIARFEIDPLQLPADRRGHHINIVYPGLSLIVDRDEKRRFHRFGNVHIDRRGAQRQKERSDHHRSDQAEDDSGSGPGQMVLFLRHSLVFKTLTRSSRFNRLLTNRAETAAVVNTSNMAKATVAADRAKGMINRSPVIEAARYLDR